MTDREIRQLWIYINSQWQQFDVPKSEEHRAVWVRAWLDHLEDLPVHAVRAALISLGNDDHPPKPGQLRAEALTLIAQAAGDAIPEVDQAWEEVRRALAEHGRRRRPSFSHSAVAQAVEAFGWRSLCDSQNLDVARGQFARFFEKARDRAVAGTRPPAPAIASNLPATDRPNRVTELPIRGHE